VQQPWGAGRVAGGGQGAVLFKVMSV
jgi:hypothetical protein